MGPDETPFTAFGLEPSFRFDLPAVEKRFYLLSRQLHPDRFTSAVAEVRDASLARMSFLNEAFSRLKSRERLRALILELEGVRLEGKSTLPADLAEAWFDLQDIIVEDPVAAREALPDFERQLSELGAQSDAKALLHESAYDSAEGPERKREALLELAQFLRDKGYLNSLRLDVARNLARIKANIDGKTH